MSSTFRLVLPAAIISLGLASPAAAKEVRVAMVNRSADGLMAFAPGLVKIAPGDSVRFVVGDRSHNAESIPGLAPAGAVPFKGKIDQEYVVRFTAPGLYGYKCLPHLGMGMVGIIQVGAPVNSSAFTAAIAKLPPLAKARFGKYLAQVR